MAFYFSKRKIRPSDEEHQGELNIIPYLDILMNLIIFMLLSMTGLATFGILNVSAPNSAAGGPGESPDKPPLLLTVAIAKGGFFVAATGGVLGGGEQPAQAPGEGAPTIPKKPDGTYDFDALTAKMQEIKGAFPNDSKVILAAELDTQYEQLIATMDAVRENKEHKLLFPDVTLGRF